MVSHDIVMASGLAYKKAWEERRYLLRLALVPMLIKIACYVAVIRLGWDDMFIRQAVVMLPAYLAEGWLLAHFTRLLFLGQRWPFMPTGDEAVDRAALSDRMIGITGGAVTYALIRFLLAGVTALLQAGGDAAGVGSGAGGEPGPNDAAMLPIAIAAMVLMFWSFRLLWLYIPAALGYPLRAFVKNLGGFRTSLPLIGAWMICVAPGMFVFTLFALVMVSPYGGGKADDIPAGVTFTLNLMHVGIDTAVSIIATAGIAEIVRGIMSGGAKKA